MSSSRNVRQKVDAGAKAGDRASAGEGEDGGTGCSDGPNTTTTPKQNITSYLYQEVYDGVVGTCAAVQTGNLLQGLVQCCHRMMAMMERGGDLMNPNHIIEVNTIFSTLVLTGCIGGYIHNLIYFTDVALHYDQDGKRVEIPNDDHAVYLANNPGVVLRTIPANENVFHSFLLNAQDLEERNSFELVMKNFLYGILRVYVASEAGGVREPHFVSVLFRNDRYYLTTAVRGSTWFSCSNLVDLLYTDKGKTALWEALMDNHGSVELNFPDIQTQQPSFFCPKVYLKSPLNWTDELRASGAEELIEWPVSDNGRWPPRAKRAVKFVPLHTVADIDV